MDQKTWRWRKRSSEKSIDASFEGEISVKGNEEEKLQYEKEAALQRTVKSLHEKVASLLCECNAKDNLIVEHAKTAQESIAGREKAEAEIVIRNQELEEALQQKVEANERLIHLNAALKDYRQQLSSLKEEQDQRVNEAVYELEKSHKKLEEKFTETNKKLTNLTVENAHLANALVTKNELISRLDSAEKENGILKYEYQVLERELEIRNRCADVANRQHQESLKRVAKLDAECQKLRSLVKRGVPVKPKHENENNHLESLDKRMSFMIKRLCEIEEENKILKQKLHKQDDEIRVLQRTTIGESVRSEMSLMDDFVEMERLAIVSIDAVSSEASNLNSIGKELVPVDSDWLQNVLNEISEQTRVSKRSFEELMEDIRVALKCRYYSSSNDEPVSGYITWKSPETERSNFPNNEILELKISESETSIENVKKELENVKESKRVIEEQLENQKLINEDLDHQISVCKVQINEANQKVSSLKVELEDRSHSCEELEATCLELQLQLASVSDKDVKNVDFEQEEKMLRTGWEITAASAKLAECQETIFSIGRQLKALTPPTEAAAELTHDKKSTHHSSLRDHMVASNDHNIEDFLSSPKTKEIISTTETKELSVLRVGSCNASRVVPGALAIVPSKKRSKGTELLRKLLFRRKRGSGKKKVLTIGV